MTYRDILLDPEIFENPMSFEPGRWISTKLGFERLSRNFLPFGRGGRMCLGVK